MNPRIRNHYEQKYGFLGAATLALIEKNIIASAKRALESEGFDGRVELRFLINSYDAKKGVEKFVLDLAEFQKAQKGEDANGVFCRVSSERI